MCCFFLYAFMLSFYVLKVFYQKLFVVKLDIEMIIWKKNCLLKMTIIKFSLTYTTFEKIRELLDLKIDFGQEIFFFFFCQRDLCEGNKYCVWFYKAGGWWKNSASMVDFAVIDENLLFRINKAWKENPFCKVMVEYWALL